MAVFYFCCILACLIYVTVIANSDKWRGMAALHNPVIVFLLVSMGVLLILVNFECGKALAEELPKEIKRISKELSGPKSNP